MNSVIKDEEACEIIERERESDAIGGRRQEGRKIVLDSNREILV